MKILIDCINLKFKIKNLKFNRLLNPTYIENNKSLNNFYFRRILFLRL